MLPAVFLRLCSHFHQDVDVVYQDFAQAITAFVAREDAAAASELVTYLRSDLLQQKPEVVAATWDSCGSDLFFSDTAAFLREVADRTEATLQKRQQ